MAGLKLSKAKAYKNRIWDKASTKASQYYKGRKNKLDLSYIKSVEFNWNPLMPKCAIIRRFKRHLVIDDHTMNSIEYSKCKINEDMHDRHELPYMLFNLNNNQNTKIVFDVTRISWSQFTQRLMIWCDIAKMSNNSDKWNHNKFDLLETNDLPNVHLKNPFQLWNTFFPEYDQPMKYNEFINQNNNDNKTYRDLVIQTDHNFSSKKTPNWDNNLKSLHTTNDFVPEIDFQCVVWDDNGLVYPCVNEIPNIYRKDFIKTQGYILEKFLQPFINQE